MTDPDREAEWFGREAFGADRIESAVRRPLVLRLLQIADQVGFDFRAEVLRASAWASTHRSKKRWDRFYLNWFGRAESDGHQGDKQFDADVEKFK